MIRTIFCRSQLTFSRTLVIYSNTRLNFCSPVFICKNSANSHQIRLFNFWQKSSETTACTSSEAKEVEVVDVENPVIDIDVDIENARFLEFLGVDVTWYNPVSHMMRLFEETHVGLHLPWWQTFIFATVIVRVCFFGMSMIMAIPFNKQGKLHAAENMYHFIDLCSVVLPIWAIVKMNTLEYPGLAHGGTLWFENLMQIDRYLVFPVTGVAIVFLSFSLDRKYIKINMDKLGDPPSKFFHKWFLINTAICLPILMGTMYLSAGASLSFLTSSVCAPFFLALRGHYAKEQNYQTREDMLNMMKLHFKGEPIPPKKKLPKRVQEIIKK